MSNEEDKMNFKITKIRLPEKVKLLESSAEGVPKLIGTSKDVISANSDNVVATIQSRLGDGRREIAPFDKHLNKREESLLVVQSHENLPAKVELPNQTVTLVESSFDDKIIGFEVF